MDFSFDEYVKTAEQERNLRWPHTKLLLDQDGDGGERLWARVVDADNRIALLDNNPLDRRWWPYDLVRYDARGKVVQLVKRTYDQRLGLLYCADKDEAKEQVVRKDIYDRVAALGEANTDMSFFVPGMGFIHIRNNTERNVSTQDVVDALKGVEQVYDISDLTKVDAEGKFEAISLYRLPPRVDTVLAEYVMNGEEVKVVAKRYPNDRLAVVAVDKDWQPYAHISVNVPELPIGPLEFIVANQLGDADIDELIATTAFVDTGTRVDYGFVSNARVLAVR